MSIKEIVEVLEYEIQWWDESYENYYKRVATEINAIPCQKCKELKAEVERLKKELIDVKCIYVRDMGYSQEND